MPQKISLGPGKKHDDGVRDDLFGIALKALEEASAQFAQAIYTKMEMSANEPDKSTTLRLRSRTQRP